MIARRHLFILIALVLTVVSCSDAGAESTTSTPPTTSSPTGPDGSVTLPPSATAGRAEDLLNGVDSATLAEVALPVIQTDLQRTTPDAESDYLGVVRDDPSSGEPGAVVPLLDDAAVLYLGYLFCAIYEATGEPAPSVTGVVDVVARSQGRQPTQPADADFVASVTIANLSSGSLCPNRYVTTRAFLDELLDAG